MSPGRNAFFEATYTHDSRNATSPNCPVYHTPAYLLAAVCTCLSPTNTPHTVQGTRPQTLGYALADSPVALLAWIYEKLVDWTDAYPWTDDEVCTWVSIYWFSTAGPRAAHQLYYEVFHATKGKDFEEKKSRGIYVSGFDDINSWQDVKIGFGHFPKDVVVLPKEWGRVLGRVVYEKEHERGGHFAAWEVPELLVSDLREMFGVGGGAHGAVKTGSS